MSKKYGKVMSLAVLVAGLLVAGRGMTGSLDPTNAPGPTMHTLEEIYQKQADTYQKVEAFVTPQTLSDTTTVVQAGYYAATTLTAVDADLAAGNIVTNAGSAYPAMVAKTGQAGGMSAPAVAKACERVLERLKTDRSAQRIFIRIMRQLKHTEGLNV